MTSERIETELDEPTLKRLDDWRAAHSPQSSRSEAVRLFLEEWLTDWRRIRAPERRDGRTYPSADKLAALYTLERVTGFGPAKFRAMHEAGVDARTAIEDPDRLPFTGRTGDKLRRGISSLSQADSDAGMARAVDQLERARDLSALIFVHGDQGYPKRVYESNNPVPVLYVRGNPQIWESKGTVAVVGSRNTREPYASGVRRFAAAAASQGIVVVSGFAVGADSIGHNAAVDAGGRTVCVMPCGLDKVFPPENRSLWDKLLAHPEAVFVSEFGFGQRASSLLLRKRNKLIAAFSQGIVVVQSAVDGGAMNAYRFGQEQGKSVATFKADGSQDTSGNRLIENDRRTGGLAFELTDQLSRYETWLRQLSSLI